MFRYIDSSNSYNNNNNNARIKPIFGFSIEMTIIAQVANCNYINKFNNNRDINLLNKYIIKIVSFVNNSRKMHTSF